MLKYLYHTVTYRLNYVFGLLCVVLCTDIYFAQQRPSDAILGKLDTDRSSWNAIFYNIQIHISDSNLQISGIQNLYLKALKATDSIRIDLQYPMQISQISYRSMRINFIKTPFYYKMYFPIQVDSVYCLQITFNGIPPQAQNPPWDGGLVRTTDQKGRPWISLACQGIAGSIWYPCKDHMSDEPDSMKITLHVPKYLKGVSNGKYQSVAYTDSTAQFTWKVSAPINNYNIIPNVGHYITFSDTFLGRAGVLPLNYWVLDYDSIPAVNQFGTQVKSMLRCFEDWFGPYPFYTDGYKLIQSPFLGMEHQSGIAYGNGFSNGYLGEDLSQTGWGYSWDYIIVHESGHEWFGNNISVKDVADNWIHEGFTCYSENLFVEYLFGKTAGSEYVLGLRSSITNKNPIIANYNINQSPDNDIYYKGANILHYIRQIVNSDSLWKACLRHLNQVFKHQTVSSAQVENEMSSFLHLDLSRFFDQYLRNSTIPNIEYYVKRNTLFYRSKNTISNLILPVRFYLNSNNHSNNVPIWINAGSKWQSVKLNRNQNPVPDTNCYVQFVNYSKTL